MLHFPSFLNHRLSWRARAVRARVPPFDRYAGEIPRSPANNPVSESTPTRGWRGRRLGSWPRKVAPRFRSPAGRREQARTRARPFPRLGSPARRARKHAAATAPSEALAAARPWSWSYTPVGGQSPALELPVVEPGVEAAERPGRGEPATTAAQGSPTARATRVRLHDACAARRAADGRRTVRPPPVREAWSTGAEVAAAPWQTRRPPPRWLPTAPTPPLLAAGRGQGKPPLGRRPSPPNARPARGTRGGSRGVGFAIQGTVVESRHAPMGDPLTILVAAGATNARIYDVNTQPNTCIDEAQWGTC